METKKLCIFLAIVFAFLSILFSVLYLSTRAKQNYLDEDYISQVQTNLNSRGIKLGESLIKEEIPTNSIYSLKAEYSEESAVNLAKNIASEVYKNQNTSTTCFETPEGLSVGVYSDSKELFKVVYSQCDFVFEFIDEEAKNETKTIQNYKFSQKNIIIDLLVENIIEKFVSMLNNGKLYSYKIENVNIDDGFLYASLVQMLDGQDIKDTNLKLAIYDNRVVYASGKWIVFDVGKQYREPLIDGADILYKLPLKSVSEINSQKIVYTLKQVNEDVYYYIPTWKIQYRDKFNLYQSEYFDAIFE